MEPASDNQLVEQAVQGDTAAFEQLVYRFQDRLVRSLEHSLGSRDDALEIAQQAFLAAWRNIGSFRGQSGFYSWLYRIAHNLAVTHHRQNRHPTVSLDALSEDSGLNVADRAASHSPSEELERQDDLSLIRKALSQIPEEFRQPLILKEIDGFSYEEISRILDVPMGTVRSRIFRARQELAERLKRMR